MKRKWILWWTLVVGFLLVPLVSAAVIDPDVVAALEDDESVAVIVTLHDSTKTSGMIASGKSDDVLQKLDAAEDISAGNFELDHQFESINGFSGTATKDGVDALAEDSNVKSIEYDRPLRLLLSNSRPQINADEVQAVSLVGEQINGTGETVCIIDTGIDYTHPAFGSCTLEMILDGVCPGVIGGIDIADDDDDPQDTDGHGTHVAGIVASRDGTYMGIALGAQIAAVKVFADNSAVASTSDVILGVEWCQNQSSALNISVISLSLGDDEVSSSSNCDNDPLAAVLNAAVGSGFFVDAASGNDGNSTGIAAPSCASNVTSVGSVNNGDAVSSFSNSAANLDLLAPGHAIKSVKLGGGFVTYAGTSMAAPHVAGAAALFLQYWKKAYGVVPTARQIEDKLKATGKKVADSRNGLIFSRIDIREALRPILSFPEESISNGTILGVENALIEISSDVPLDTAVLQWDYGNGSVENLTMNALNTTTFQSNLTDLPAGNYTYSVFGNDSGNFLGVSAERILFVDTSAPEMTLAIPGVNLTYSAAFTMNVSFVDQFELAQARYSVLNASSGVIEDDLTLFNNISVYTLSKLINVSNSTYPDGNYTLLVFAQDGVGNEANVSRLFTVSNTPPINVTITPANGSVVEVGLPQSFTATAIDAEGDGLTYTWNFGDGGTAEIQNTTHLFNATGTFTVVLTINDGRNIVATNQSVLVNDTIGPTSSLTYDLEHHLERDGQTQTITSTSFDYSGVSDATLLFNGLEQNASCSAAKTSLDCSWGLAGLSVGSFAFTLNATDNFTSPHTVSQEYSFTVTSCSDSLENGNEDGVDCGGSCSASCSSSSGGGGGSSGGGGSGGGGGGSSGNTGSSDTTSSSTSSTSSGEESSPAEQSEIDQELSIASAVLEDQTAADESTSSGSALTGSAIATTDTPPTSHKKLAFGLLGGVAGVLLLVFAVGTWVRRRRERFDWE